MVKDVVKHRLQPVKHSAAVGHLESYVKKNNKKMKKPDDELVWHIQVL